MQGKTILTYHIPQGATKGQAAKQLLLTAPITMCSDPISSARRQMTVLCATTSWSQGNAKRSQTMMRARVAAQGLTVAAMMWSLNYKINEAKERQDQSHNF